MAAPPAGPVDEVAAHVQAGVVEPLDLVRRGAHQQDRGVGDLVDLIGPEQSVDRVAEYAGTIGYEILTGLGARFHRRYVGAGSISADEQAERAAAYFAGCALVPRTALKRAWGNGIQRPGQLAAHFDVSEQAMRVRLSQTGLDVAVDRLPTPRCARPARTPRFAPQQFRPMRRTTWRYA